MRLPRVMQIEEETTTLGHESIENREMRRNKQKRLSRRSQSVGKPKRKWYLGHQVKESIFKSKKQSTLKNITDKSNKRRTETESLYEASWQSLVTLIKATLIKEWGQKSTLRRFQRD